MARARLFPFLFLIPLILGCFPNTSRAEGHTHRPRKYNREDDIPESVFRQGSEETIQDPKPKAHYRIMGEQPAFPTEAPKPKAHYRIMGEQPAFPTEAPKSQAHYRIMGEQPSLPPGIPLPEASYRELKEGADDGYHDGYEYRQTWSLLGFRKNLVNEIRDVLDAFDKAYLENGKCEKLKEKVSKVMGFLRVALDFVN